MKNALLLSLALIAVGPVAVEGQTVVQVCTRPGLLLSGVPSRVVNLSPDGGEMRELSVSEAEESHFIISCSDDGKILWTSRENRELIYTPSGSFGIFTSELGSGVIRILKNTTLYGEDPFLYSESLRLGIDQYVYYGRRLIGRDDWELDICYGYPQSRAALLRSCRE